jgi:hypothetical protein
MYYNIDNTHAQLFNILTRQQPVLTTIDQIITTYIMTTITLGCVSLITYYMLF